MEDRETETICLVKPYLYAGFNILNYAMLSIILKHLKLSTIITYFDVMEVRGMYSFLYVACFISFKSFRYSYGGLDETTRDVT